MNVSLSLSAPALPTRLAIISAAAGREFLSNRLNRFLQAHLVLVVVAGLLPLLTPGEALGRGAAWWLLHAVLYAVSLSSLLLGLSSAHAENDEFPWLLGQPRGPLPWLVGKALALLALVGVMALLLAAPTLMAGGRSSGLALVALGAAGLSAGCALTGLALGFWIRDGVRGLVTVIAVWFALLFGTDLLLLGVAGSPWVQQHADLWVAPLMLNPFDAFRVTVLFNVEQAAFSGLDAGRLAGWWVAHAPAWLAGVFAAWLAAAGACAWRGAVHRRD